MKTQLPLKELERNMREHMLRDKVYSLKELYALYILRMSVDQRIRSYERMTIGSLEKRAREWSKPGMWMVKIGRGEDRVYFKRVIHRSSISAAKLKAKANEIIECAKGRMMWWK